MHLWFFYITRWHAISKIEEDALSDFFTGSFPSKTPCTYRWAAASLIKTMMPHIAIFIRQGLLFVELQRPCLRGVTRLGWLFVELQGRA